MRVAERTERFLLILPILLVLVGFTAFPYIVTFILGFFRIDIADPSGTRFLCLRNYTNAFLDPRFWNSLKITAIFVGTATGVESILGSALALLLQRIRRGRGVFQALLLVPMVVPPIVVGLNWRMLYDSSYGILNYFLTTVGFPPQAWLSHSSYALMALLLVDFWQYTPFVTLLVLAQLLSLPDEPYEAAEIDGASTWQTITHITLPMIKTGLAVVVMLRAIEAFKEFAKIYTLTSGGPGVATETLNFYVYMTGFEYYQMGYSSALATILFCAAMGLSALLMVLTRSLSEGGVLQ